jgi:hypothetical protein
MSHKTREEKAWFFDTEKKAWLSRKTLAPMWTSSEGMVFDAKVGRFLFMRKEGLWQYNPVKDTWIAPKPEAGGPTDHSSPGLVYDSTKGVTLHVQNDGQVFRYDFDKESWIALEPRGRTNGKPLLERSQGVVYDPEHNAVLGFGYGEGRTVYAYRYKNLAVGR